METRCRCGNLVAQSFDEFGCIQCGRACCPACGVRLESVMYMYCARCAGGFMEVPAGLYPGASP